MKFKILFNLKLNKMIDELLNLDRVPKLFWSFSLERIPTIAIFHIQIIS